MTMRVETISTKRNCPAGSGGAFCKGYAHVATANIEHAEHVR